MGVALGVFLAMYILISCICVCLVHSVIQQFKRKLKKRATNIEMFIDKASPSFLERKLKLEMGPLGAWIRITNINLQNIKRKKTIDPTIGAVITKFLNKKLKEQKNRTKISGNSKLKKASKGKKKQQSQSIDSSNCDNSELVIFNKF